MKATTKKILIWLYNADSSESRWVKIEDLRLLLPELKNSGFRSLIALLKNQQLIALEVREVGVVAGSDPAPPALKTLVRLTTYGRNSLEAQFPLFTRRLENWEGEWSLITFLQAPKSDSNFRYLRKFLLDQRCAQLARGVYLYPGEIPSDVGKLLSKLYIGAVLVVEINKWVFGDEKSIVTKLFLLSDLKNTYSGISDEAGRLLRQKNQGKARSDQYKQAVYMVFDRLLEIISLDLGLLHFYYPEAKGGIYLLSRLQELF